jgi:hypothetical protein
MVRPEIGEFRVLSRGGVSPVARALGLCAAVIAAATCGTSSRTSTGPTPLKCQPSVALSTPSIGAAGGNASLSVTTQQECTWSVTSEAGWISGLTPSSGQGSAQVAFSVATNPAASVRQGDLVVNDQRIQVRQEAAPCRYGIAPKSHALDAGGDEWQVQVTAVTGCTWRATSDVSWITVKAGSSGSQDGMVVVEASPNDGQDPRVGSLTIAGESFAVAQSGVAVASPTPPPPTSPAPQPPPGPQPPACSYSLSPATHAAPAAGGSGSTSLQATHSACVWTVSTDAAWLTPSTNVGVGTQTVGFQIAANTGAARIGRLTLAGQILTVTQAAPGQTCTYSINPTSLAAAATGATASTVTVTAGAGCAWTATTATSWITITAGASGSGPGSVVFNVAANPGAARSGTLTIAGQTFTVNQSTSCTYSISPTSQSVSAGSTNNRVINVDTSSSCSWTAVSNVAWITIDRGSSDQGDGQVEYDVASNPGQARQGTITVAGHTFSVNQAGQPCSYSISSNSQSFTAAGGAGSVSVSTQSWCTWTATSNDSWIVVTQGGTGTGNGGVLYTVVPNSGKSRTGTITIAGRVFTVSQSGDDDH